MNYRHHYHAGNFTDVLKHWHIVKLLEHLHQKEKPFFVLDTHAGKGLYDLQAPEAQRTAEFHTGIVPLLAATSHHALFQPYLEVVQSCNNGENNLRYYPGSPLIISHFLRPQDRATVIEKHPETFHALQTILPRTVTAYLEDGYHALKKYLPHPTIGRCLLVIDPPYESLEETKECILAINEALKRCKHAMIALWYPCTAKVSSEILLASLQKLGVPLWSAELYLTPTGSAMALQGCGMAILNPPYQFDRQMESSLPTLAAIMSPQASPCLIMKWWNNPS